MRQAADVPPGFVGWAKALMYTHSIQLVFKMDTSRIRRLPTMSASERAYRHVKERVLEGSIPGGELISENEIAEQLGMSRTPVRAAFGQLESEGLLRLYPKRGALVVPVSAQETEAVMETRWVIERYAIERVVERPGDVPEQLLAAVAAQADLEGTAFVDSDRAFHRALVA